MTANQAMFPISKMCKSFGVSRSGYYAWLVREPSARSIADAALTDRIRVIHAASRETYGAPRIHAELADEGIQVGCKRVERLVRHRMIWHRMHAELIECLAHLVVDIRADSIYSGSYPQALK